MNPALRAGTIDLSPGQVEIEVHAAGLNFTILFRWHFLRRETWSIFMDGGAGFLLTTNDVPQIGTNSSQGRQTSRTDGRGCCGFRRRRCR